MIADALAYLGFDPLRDFQVRDDGAGPYIAKWYSEQPQPTTAEIEAARKPAALALVTERIKAERDRRELETGCPVTFPGVDGVWRFHTDTLASRHLLALFSLAFRLRAAGGTDSTPMPGAAFNPGFKTMGREDRIPMTVRRVELLEQAVMVKAGALHVVAQQHIDAAALLDDPLSYDYSTGWPE